MNGAGSVRDDNSQHMRNYAGFANAEFDVASFLTLKGGVRRSQANRDSNAAGYTVPGAGPAGGLPYTFTQFFNLVYGLIYGPGVIPTVQEGQPFVLDTRVNPDGTPVDPSTYLKTGRYYGKLREGSTSWSVGADFKPSDSTLLYVNVKKGYKSGSFPILAAAIFDGELPVTQESLLDYEGGIKTKLANGKISLSAGAFYYDYRNKQLLTKFVDPIFGQLDKLQNVPKSDVKGAEFEALVRPFRGLTIDGNVTFIDAKVKKYDGVIGQKTVGGLRQPILASFKGAALPFSAKWQYSVRADYETPVSSTLSGFIGIGLHGQSSSYSTLAITDEAKADYKIKAYALVDGNIGIKTANDTWRLTVWGKNIFNKYYVTNRFMVYDTLVRTTGRPAEYGATVAYRF